LSLYIDDIPSDDLRDIINCTYTKEIFGTKEITPLVKISERFYLQHLSNGPTLAFKDIALQLLGNLFEYELSRKGQELNILGATSGDTGSAAEYAMLGKKGIRVFMLSPNDRMSPFQQAQMYSLNDPNIFNIAVKGNFDDCQDIVKLISKDAEFKSKYNIGTVNSINWARILAQTVYYFYGYFQMMKENTTRFKKVSFAVPTGNFGNICSGYIARKMGLPIGRLLLATNENNILDDFFNKGEYYFRKESYETSSPSMDISKASNLERYVFDFLGRDSFRTQQLFSKPEGFKLSSKEISSLVFSENEFIVGSSNHLDRIRGIQFLYDISKIVIDPHTADAVDLTTKFLSFGQMINVIILETAQPCKFTDTIHEALSFYPDVPKHLRGIDMLNKFVIIMDPSFDEVKEFIKKHCPLI
jgi:threonine synthase